MQYKKVAIIQARMTSTRLPGKVMMNIGEKSMLAHIVDRVSKCNQIDEIVIATSDKSSDDTIRQLANQLKIACFRGSEQDVLSRFVGAARLSHAEMVVRITADCPLIDPDVIDCVVTNLMEGANRYDYASNVQRRTFPHGLDTEAFFLDTLLRIDRLGKSQTAREHVTTFLRLEHPELFWIKSVEDDEDHSAIRWTVDAAPDLEVIRLLYKQLNLEKELISYKEVIDFIKKHPQINQMNANIKTWQPEQKKTF